MKERRIHNGELLYCSEKGEILLITRSQNNIPTTSYETMCLWNNCYYICYKPINVEVLANMQLVTFVKLDPGCSDTLSQ